MHQDARKISEPTVITIKNGYGEYSVSTDHSDVDLNEMLELIRRVLLAAGYYVKDLGEVEEDGL